MQAPHYIDWEEKEDGFRFRVVLGEFPSHPVKQVGRSLINIIKYWLAQIYVWVTTIFLRVGKKSWIWREAQVPKFLPYFQHETAHKTHVALQVIFYWKQQAFYTAGGQKKIVGLLLCVSRCKYAS